MLFVRRCAYQRSTKRHHTHAGLNRPPSPLAPSQPTCAAAIRTSHRPVIITRCSRAISNASIGLASTAAAASCCWLQPSASASCAMRCGLRGRGCQAYSPAPKLAFSPSHQAADLLVATTQQQTRHAFHPAPGILSALQGVRVALFALLTSWKTTAHNHHSQLQAGMCQLQAAAPLASPP